ncbi:hypothetical protein DDB_G0271648 [Dictyostelium discoideum AX4]|uniref:Uncharacterized protein n=1 Tax=Dictyostelium discoideum TaxID=44689 RepID=Q55AU0_DICDI|nr:hypothetical protein DDB_G0271648 [Dictyostelium discoideum AX4]EAL71688.1 hypothetical protein DDB_G0271648 [Dictyostelium discoideum AX4]|eukprot:XP_645606.1 hypothetical protein DDB_G0271648 [Dictyostelium discoideum AX4]
MRRKKVDQAEQEKDQIDIGNSNNKKKEKIGWLKSKIHKGTVIKSHKY